MTDLTPNFDNASVVAWLEQRSRADRSELLEELALMLAEVVPGAQVERTLLRRQITTVKLPLAGYTYVLHRANGTFEASRQQVVRGVVIRTIPMDIESFLSELGVALDVELQRTEKGRAALQAWLNSPDRS